LADAFNSMIAKLEKSFEKEKQFTSDAAHELRTPISVIQSHCEYCLDELKLTDSVREEIEIIYKIIKSFWYPDEYYDRKNNHTLFNKIKRYIGFLIIFISVYLFMVITFFASNRLSLLEIIIRIVAMLYILMCCRKYLM